MKLSYTSGKYGFVGLAFSLLSFNAFAGTPNVTNELPSKSFSGEQVCFNSTFSNTNVSEVGYGPYVRVDTPVGISLDSATLLGSNVTIENVGTFSSGQSNQLTDPRSNTTVSSLNGHELNLLVLPIGSVVQGGPPLDLNICVTLADTMPIGVFENVALQGVFQFGNSANGTTATIGSNVTQSIAPTIYKATFSNTAPESETVPGASFPKTFNTVIDIANGKTVYDVSADSSLDAGFRFVQGTTTNIGGTGYSETVPSPGSDGGAVNASLNSALGSGSNSDVSLSYQIYATDILDETQCNASILTNTSSVSAEFPDNTLLSAIDSSSSITAKHMAVRQSVNSSSVVPNDQIEVTNRIDLTEFGTADSLSMADIIPDGLSFVGHVSAELNGTPFAITPVETAQGGGISELAYDIHAVTGNIAAGSTIVIKYTVSVQQAYDNATKVLASDSLTIATDIDYSLVEGAGSSVACLDDSGSTLTVIPVENELSLVGANTEFAPTETVVYRHKLDVVSGDAEVIKFETFLPLPVFDVANINLAFGNDITHGPNHTDLSVVPSSITVDTDSNKLIIAWPNLGETASQTLEVDVAVTVVDEPFDDNLFLTTLFQASTENSSAVSNIGIKPVQINVRAPVLEITHGVSATTGDGTVSSANSPVDADVTNVDAGDTNTYVITVENTGGAEAHDIKVTAATDTSMENYTIVSVTDGLGNNLAYTGDLFSTGLNITPTLAKNDGSPGETFSTDTAIITYTADIKLAAATGDALATLAEVDWTSAANATRFTAVSDETSTQLANANILVSVDSIAPNGGSGGNVVVGDTISYQALITLPEGTTESLVSTINLPSGYEYQSSSVDTTGYAGTVDTAPTVAVSGVIDSTGQVLTVSFDSPANTVTTADNTSNNNTFAFNFDVLVKDSNALSAKSATQSRSLSSSLAYTNASGGISDSVNTDFSEHVMSVSSSFSPATNLSAGDVVTVTIEASNTGTAPAYDVVVSDLINTGIFDNLQITEQTTPAGFTYSFASDTVTYEANNGISVATGSTLTFVYTAVVKDDVTSGSTYTNSTSVTGDSQEGSAVTETRDSQSNVTVSASVAQLAINDFALLTSSEPWTSDTATIESAIGEVMTYQMIVSIPEALHSDTLAKDFVEVTLPPGVELVSGSALVRVDNVTSTITGSNYNGGSALPAVDTSITPTVTGSVVGFDLGNVQNNDDDVNEELLVLTFKAQTLNVSDNNKNDSKSVAARVNYNNFDSEPQALVQNSAFTVVESDLSISQVASPTTVTGGDSVSFTSVITNQNSTGSARAWDLTASATLPADFESLAVTSATLSRGSADITACLVATGQDLNFDMSCLSEEQAYLAPTETITLAFTADVVSSVGFEKQISNILEVQATSLRGTNGTASATSGVAGSDTGERTGTSATNTSGEAVNDLAVAATATVTSGKPSLLLVAASEDLHIEETTVITGTIAIPVGTTDNFVVTYDLPTGLSFTGTDVVISEPGANYSSSKVPQVSFVAGSDPLVFDFGTITNSGNSAQQITIAVESKVDNIASNQSMTNLSSVMSLSYDGVTNPVPSITETVTVIEPVVNLSKSITAGATNSDAGDTISYQINLSNTDAKGTAYLVSLKDVLPEELLGAPDGTGSGTTISNVVVTNASDLAVLSGTATPLSSSDFTITTTTATNDTLSFANFDLPPSASITVTFDAVVANSAQSGQVISSESTASYNSLASGNGRDNSDIVNNSGSLNDYQESATSSLTVDSSLAVQAGLSAIHLGNSFSIGDSITYDIRLDLVEGTSNNVDVESTLPAGLSFVESTIVAGGNFSYTGSATATETSTNVFEVALGNVTNVADGDSTNDFLIVQVKAKVDDVPSNVDSTQLTTSVSASSDSAAAGPATQAITIVEPNLEVTFTPSTTDVTIGDTVNYSVVVAHSASTADAFDTSVQINIPDGLEYIANSFSGSGNVQVDVDGNLIVDLDVITLAAGNKTFGFDVIANNDAIADSALTINTTNGVYSSRNGEPTVDRTYSFSGASTVTPRLTSTIDVVHSSAIIIDNGEAGTLDPDDTLEYTIVITNNGADADNVVYVESIPNYTSYVATSAATDLGSVSEPVNSELSFDIGTLTSGQTATLSYQVKVNSSVSAGSQIRAQGQVDSSSTIPELSDSDNNDSNGDQATVNTVLASASNIAPLYIQELAEWITDADNDGSISPGDTIELTYFIQNTSNSALTNVDVTETLPTGVSYINASSTISGANTINVVGQAVSIAIPELATNNTVSAQINVMVDGPLYDSDGDTTKEVFTHISYGNSDQTEQIRSDRNGNPSDGYQDTAYTAVSGIAGQPELSIILDWILVNDQNGNGLVESGDEVLYEFTVENIGSANVSNAMLSNQIPQNTTLVANSAYSSGGVLVSGDPFAVNLGSINPGAVINAGFIVSVNNDLPADTTIESQGSVSGDNIATTLSDDNAQLDDGRNPTLLAVADGSDVNAGQPVTTVSLTNTSDVSTSGNDFVQGEELTFEIKVVAPLGETADTVLNIDVPDDFTIKTDSVLLKREFDTGLTAAFNPGNINNTAANTYVNVSADLMTNNQTSQLILGSIINSDNDVNDESFVVQLVLESAAIVPTASIELIDLNVSASFVNNANVTVNTAPEASTVSLLNRLPNAVSDSYSNVNEDSSNNVLAVLTNDFDLDTGHTIAITGVSSPSSQGSVTISGDSINYSPGLNFNGQDAFTYTITDSAGGSKTGTVTVDVTAINDAPSAIPDVVDVTEDQLSTLTPLTNDSDLDGDTISLKPNSVSALNGSVTIDGNSIKYQPNQDFTGEDTVNYCIQDPDLVSACSTMTLNVENVNDAPVALDDAIDVEEDKAQTIDVLANDSDIDGDALSIVIAATENGSATVNEVGELVFTPAADFVGQASVSYCAVDASNAEGCAIAIINVTAIADAPRPVNDLAETNEDTSLLIQPLINDGVDGSVDVDGEAISLLSAEALRGSLTLNTDNSLNYTPPKDYVGTDTIDYCIADTSGLSACATITVTMNAINDAPVALNDTAQLVVDEVVNLDVLKNDFDIDSEILTVTNVTAPKGSATINSDNTINFVPPLGFFGEIVLTYTVTDNFEPTALEASAQVVIAIKEPVEIEVEPPTVVDESVTTDNWDTLTLDVLANDLDPQGGALSLLAVSASIGTVEIVDGQLVYSPIEGLVGPVTIEYVVANESGETSIGTLTIDYQLNDAALNPTLNIPADLCGARTVNANALYTRVDVGKATAVDRFGNPLPVSVVNNNLLFPPGVNTVLWQTTDLSGRSTTKVQNVCVKPLVSLDKDRVVTEGESVTVGVYINGEAPVYPVDIDYTVSGTATDGEDYVVTSGLVSIESGTETSINFNILSDLIAEQDETITVTLSDTLNRGTQLEHVITITESNIAPEVSLLVKQSNQRRLTVSQTTDKVVIESKVYDPNTGDSFTYEWDSSLQNLSGAESKFIFDPSVLDEGVYKVTVVATDSGLPGLSDRETVFINVVAELPVLGTGDSDGDLIPDNVEGFQDSDRDGIPDYLDRVMECNVLLENSSVQNQYLVEGDPGICVRRGELSFEAKAEGALILEEGTEVNGVVEEDPVATNIGGVMDFIAYGLSENDTAYRLAMPLRKPVPQNAVYRKYRAGEGWGYFVENDTDSLWSTKGEPGYCPPTGSPLWTPGLTKGDWCVQVIITDGGPNDDDNESNGTIVDPGYVGILTTSNRAPIAGDDELSMPFNQTVTIDVLANDTDPDGDVLRIESATANFGTVTIVNNQLEYQAPTDFVGTETVHYGVEDSSGATDYAVVTVEILPNTPPEPTNDTAELTQGDDSVINVLANDTDIDGDTLVVTSATAENGSVTINADNTLTYTPNSEFSGQDTITYIVSDGKGSEREGQVTVTVIKLYKFESKTTSSGGSMNTTYLLLLLLGVFFRRWINAFENTKKMYLKNVKA